MDKPNKESIALLQARHMYDDAKVTAVEHGGSYTIGSDTLTIRVNRMAWGMFEQSILNVLRDRADIRAWAPERFLEEKDHAKCGGKGRLTHLHGTPEHERLYLSFWSFDGEIEEDAPPRTREIVIFCSECQGTGYELKPLPEDPCPAKPI